VVAGQENGEDDLSLGPVVAIGLAHYNKGKGKDKEVKEALNILTMCGEKGFTSVIVALENFDIKEAEIYATDPMTISISAFCSKK
jgi:hypothetical protein